MGHSGDQSGAAYSKQAVSNTPHKYHILINRKHFYLNHALILVLKKGNKNLYRLVVYHNKQYLTDRLDPNLKGAKISFAKLHYRRAFNKNIKAIWSEIEKGGDINRLVPPLPPLPPLKLLDLAGELGKTD